jgi:Na+/proline symporter
MAAAFLFLYVLAQVALAAWAARGTSDDEDYLVAGRSLSTLQVAFSVFATWFAAETVIATSAEVSADGLAGARVEPLGYSIGLVVLGLFVAFRLRAGGYVTVASFLGARFGAKAEVAAALFTAMGATVWAAAQLAALSVILSEITGLPPGPMLLLSTAIVLVYALVGGLKGDVVTDVLQGAVIMVVLLILLVLVLMAAGGIGAGFASIPADDLRLNRPGESWLLRAELWALPVFGSIASQEVIARALGAKSPEVARRGCLIGAAVFLTIGLVPVTLGLIGPELGLTLAPEDGFFTSLSRQVLPPWLYVLIAGAMVSAILSSVDSALLAVSAVATENALVKLKPNSTGRQRLIMARATTAAAAVTAMLIAAGGESVRAIVLTGEGVTGLLAVPLVIGLLMKRGGQWPVLAALGTALFLTMLLDWRMGVEGAFLYVIVAAALVLLAGFAMERLRSDQGRTQSSSLMP